MLNPGLPAACASMCCCCCCCLCCFCTCSWVCAEWCSESLHECTPPTSYICLVIQLLISPLRCCHVGGRRKIVKWNECQEMKSTRKRVEETRLFSIFTFLYAAGFIWGCSFEWQDSGNTAATSRSSTCLVCVCVCVYVCVHVSCDSVHV